MSTTTIRLPEDLKARVAAAAERAGVTSHNFILQAIAEKAEQEERRANFDAELSDISPETCLGTECAALLSGYLTSAFL
jgi:predicted transcriptional regulator